MKLGLQIPHFYSVPEREIPDWLSQVVESADELGFHSVWLMDHLFQLGGFEWLSPVESPMLEGYSSLGFLAARTRHLEMGLLVSPPTYRPAGLLLKTVTTLDVLSGGRMWLGLGVGWYEEEARGLGLPFPSRAERYEHLEETLRLAEQMWAGTDEPFHGDRLRLERPLNSPGPVRQPRPPILIGGSGKNRTLGLAARYADACNIFGSYYGSPSAIRDRFEILKRHCEHAGRDYDTIHRTVLDTFDLRSADGLKEMVARCRSQADLGVQMVIFNIPHRFDARIIEQVGKEVVPAIRDFSAG